MALNPAYAVRIQEQVGPFHPSYPALGHDWPIGQITSEVEHPSYFHFPDCAAACDKATGSDLPSGNNLLQPHLDIFNRGAPTQSIGSSSGIFPHGYLYLRAPFKPRRSLLLTRSYSVAYSRVSIDRAHFKDNPTYTFIHSLLNTSNRKYGRY